ncbi:FecR family protein [Kriegella aquimaris]|uniref:FecR family protein n=1 Tax=Kriegella aquimaris TaxID=192904 RepID=A0A1G9TNL0_9FLAO|nr:FecR family protein [Kriegella aquimaris]SDM48695.1 FecR family protein [Kriegella aquimaris]
MKKNITKLLIGTITEKEIIELRDWLENPKNRTILESYVRDYHDLNLTTLKSNLDEAYNKVSRQIDKKEKPVKTLFPNWTKYAAAIVILFGLGFLFQQGFFSLQDHKFPVPQETFITLELDNGTIQTIDVNGTKEVRDSEGNVVGDQNQNQISYSQANQKEELVYNTLTIPNGKKFQIELSDGTLVHLNAGSSLKYPINFLSKEPRQVFLSGEAYFNVARNELSPFIVNVDQLDVKVLGTEFNVSAYTEDISIDVVLVKGAVILGKMRKSEEEVIRLSPGQKGSYGYDSRDILVSAVNTDLYTSWMQGQLVFRNLTFNQILAKLERHYNIEIENMNTDLGQEVFNASFNNVKIEEVLSFFNDAHKIDYEIKNNKIIIK